MEKKTILSCLHVTSDPISWLCKDIESPSTYCNKALVLTAHPWTLDRLEVSYCLVQEMEEECKLQLSRFIIFIVLWCNFTKFTTMCLILWKANEPPLITLGDCIECCLEQPSEITAGMCLLDDRAKSKSYPITPSLPQHWDSRRRFWFAAATARNWIGCYVL